MCLTQQDQQSLLIASQLQQQSLGFLKRHKGAFEDDTSESESDDEADNLDSALFTVPRAAKGLFSVPEEAEISIKEGHKHLTLEECNLLQDLKRATSSQSLSDMTNFSGSSRCDTVNTGFFGDDGASVSPSVSASIGTVGFRKILSRCKSETSLTSNFNVVSSTSGSSDGEESTLASTTSEQEADWERLVGDMDNDVLCMEPSDLKDVSPELLIASKPRDPKLQLQEHMECMKTSHESQVELQKWDAKMGLRRCHCKTMMDTSASRKALLEVMGVFVEDYEPPVVRRPRPKRKTPSPVGVASGSAKSSPKPQGSVNKKLKQVPTLYNPIA